ncbi:MAG: YCF48-related protein [Bacteroidia bacterium]|nr:YCF48-related protein [Bacteroidia bacterium]
MYKKLLLTNLACFLWFSSFSQWTSLTSGTANAFTSVYFIDSSNGFAVDGDAGGIYKTSDGGTTWTLQATASYPLFSVSFGGANKGCAVGANGTVMTTVDAGTTWSPGSSGQGNGLRSVFFVGIDSAYAVGDNGTILKSLNSGMMWSQKISGTISNLKSVYFTDGITGYAVGLTGTILKTINAGVTWTTQTSGTIEDLLSVNFTDVNTGYASGSNGTIIKTTNAGLAWAPLSSGTSNILNSIRFVNASTGYAVGAVQTILKTNDAGATWYTQIPITSENLYSVYFIDANTGYTAGAFGKILKTINGGCTTPILSVSGVTTICVGNNTNLSAIGASAYVWNPSTGLDCSTCPNVIANPASNTTYSITGTSTEGCINVTAVSITVNSLNGGNISLPPPICVGGDPAAFTETNIATGLGVTTYDWKSNTDGYVSTLATTLLYDVPPGLTSSTIYRRIATFTLNGVSCTANSNDITVIVNPLPLADAGTDVPLCLGDAATLTASGGTSYTWYNGGSSISSAISLMVNPTTTTAYRVDVTNSFGCSKLDTVIVNVNTLPTISAGPPQSICLGESAILTASGIGATYVWSTGSTAISITETPVATTIYFVTGTDGNNCSANDTVQVTVNSLPIIAAGADVSVCAGQSTTLLASGGGVTYLWSTGAITNSIIETPSATTSYFVTGTDGNNCTQNDTVQVTVNSLPIVTISLSVPICEGQSETLTASGGAIFAWSTGASTNSITETPAITTTYTVTVTDINNCSDNGTATIIVNPLPIANAGADQTICIGDTAALAGAGGISYVWTDGGTSFNTPTVLVNPIASTQYTLTVTDNSGCMASDMAMIYVTPSKAISGNVHYSGGPVTSGTAVLYKYEQFQTRFDSIQIKPLDLSGNYLFDSINQGQYLVKIFADSASYPSLINTYYGDDFLWNGDSVHVINHSCNLNTTLDSVTMVELTGTGGGMGLIIGKIIEGISFGRQDGDPIPGVDVKLGKNPGGSIAATANTDSSGHFTFSGVADGNYTIYVDIPGLGRDSSYTFTVDSINNQFLNQNYIADSNIVYINPTSTVGISNPATIFENKFSVYPNPVKGNTTIEYTIHQMTDSKTTLEVTTLLGVKISSLVNANQQAGTYKYNFNPQNYQLDFGVYFVTLTINGKTTTKRIIVIE